MNINANNMIETEEYAPLLIKIDDACKLTNIGRNRMLKLVKIKGFPAYIFPGKILIDKNNLSTWLSKNYGRYKE